MKIEPLFYNNVMGYKIHPNAKLTPKLRKQIHHEKGKTKDPAKKYNVHENTIRK